MAANFSRRQKKQPEFNASDVFVVKCCCLEHKLTNIANELSIILSKRKLDNGLREHVKKIFIDSITH